MKKKKLVALLCAVGMVLGLSACGADATEESKQGTNSEVMISEEGEEQEIKAEESAESQVAEVSDDTFNPLEEGRANYDADGSEKITTDECINMVTNILENATFHYEGEQTEGNTAFFSVAIPQEIAPKNFYTIYFDVALIVDGEEIPANQATVKWDSIHLIAYSSAMIEESDLTDKSLQMKISITDQVVETFGINKEDYTKTYDVVEAGMPITDFEVYAEPYSVMFGGEEVVSVNNVIDVMPNPGYYRGTNNDIIWIGDWYTTCSVNDDGSEDYGFYYSYFIPSGQRLGLFDLEGTEMKKGASLEGDNYTFSFLKAGLSFAISAEFDNEFGMPAYFEIITKDTVYKMHIGESTYR